MSKDIIDKINDIINKIEGMSDIGINYLQDEFVNNIAEIENDISDNILNKISTIEYYLRQIKNTCNAIKRK